MTHAVMIEIGRASGFDWGAVGQIVVGLASVAVAVIAVLAVTYRPLLFATADPEVAAVDHGAVALAGTALAHPGHSVA